MLLKHDTLRRLCLARDLLREVRDGRLSIEHVAREVRISPFHFIRQFEAAFGLTPHQFRIQSRLEQARRLLALGQHSVTDVCMEVGFSSLGSFSDLFTRRVGTTPSAYQRRARPMVQVPGTLPRELFPGCLSLMANLPASAFSQFSRSARAVILSDSAAVNLQTESLDVHQAHQHHGRRSGQGTEVLHRRAGVS